MLGCSFDTTESVMNSTAGLNVTHTLGYFRMLGCSWTEMNYISGLNIDPTLSNLLFPPHATYYCSVIYNNFP